MHLAAFLAAKTFWRGQMSKRVLLLLDNQTAVAYINNLGGTVSAQLAILARDLWMWCLERDILLSAQHLPGKENAIADSESRDCPDWKLNESIFQQIMTSFPYLNVDLFASRQLLQFFTQSTSGCDIQAQLDLVWEVRDGCLPELLPQLAISGNTTLTRDFLERLRTSSSPHGDGNQHSRMTHRVRNGSAGVLKGILIPFQDQ